MSSNFFIGRGRELDTFLDELAESDQFRDPSRIFYLRGQEGIGKRTFYTQLWNQIHNSALKVIWVRPSNWLSIDNAGEWPDLFTATVDGNHELLKNRIQNLQAAWAELPQKLPVLQEAKYAASVNGLPPDEPDLRMEHWYNLFKEHILDVNGTRKDQNFRLIFVLDSYDHLSSEKKQWFSRSLFDALVAETPGVDVRFLLSGEQSFYQTLDLESYWVPFQQEVKEIDLPPLSPEETQEYARMANIIVGEDFDLHEKTGGVPKKIDEVLRSGRVEKTSLRKVDDVEHLFVGKSEEFCNWILGAVHLQIFNDESLNIFGSKKGAKRALKRLRDDGDLEVAAVEGGFQINPAWADAILRWQEQFKPEQYRNLANRVAEYREIVDQIPLREHRERLAKLSLCNYFNEDLVRKVFNGDADELLSFVRTYLHYFIKTPFNYQISMQYLPFVQNYVRLVPLEETDRLREEVQYIWEKKRTSINKEVQDVEQRLKETRQEQIANKEKTNPIVEQLNRRKRIMNLNKKARKPLFARETKYRDPSPKIRIAMQLLGGFLLVYGLLIVDLWVFTAFGVFFALLGTFWPRNSEHTQRVKRAEETNDLEPDALLNLLNLKLVGLENRASYLEMEAIKYQRRIRELDSQINEPYS